MSDEHRLDEWRDRMVRALYDELPAEERRRLEERLETDPELGREWHELEEARRLVASLAGDVPAATDLVRSQAPPRTNRRVVWLRRAAAAGVGFAAAATVFVGLLVAGLRVDRTPAGVLVGFGGVPAAAGATASPTSGLVTRRELEAVASSLAVATAARMDDLERRQAGVQTQLTNALYDAIAAQQQRQYQDLRYRIDRTAAQVGSWYPAAAAGRPDGSIDQGGPHAID